MASYEQGSQRFRRYPADLLQKIEPYKVDEGYSEETRSSDGSEASMRLDLTKCGETVMQPPLSASLEHLIRGLSEYERGDIAYDLLKGLRASSIARVFDKLWPLFHKDPLEVFPPEIMSLVLSYLEPHDLLTVSLVSGAWRERVTDSNLWRKKFNTEGWGLDNQEIAHLEATLNRPISPERARRTNHLPFERRSTNYTSAAFPQAAPVAQSRPDTFGSQREVSSIERSSSNVEMVDVDPSQMDIDPFQTPQSSPGTAVDRSTGPHTSYSGGRFTSTHQRRPLVITSSPGYSRINYHYIFKQKRRLEDNWDKGCYQNFQLPHRDSPHEAHRECVYTIQYQGDFLVSGSRDKTLRIWSLSTGRLLRKPLQGHEGSVLCLQFDSNSDEDIIISGSSDTNVILWRFSTGTLIKKISQAHVESVLNLRFDHRYLVTCSKDKTIKIWNRHRLQPGDDDYPRNGHPGGGQCPPYILVDPVITEIPRWQPSKADHLMELEPYVHLMTLGLHGAAVNAIQIYKDHLVSASGDRTLRLWDIHTGQSLSKIPAHEKGIACVQYDGKRIVSGSSDNSIRIWDPASKAEVARLEGHTRLVRTLQAAFADVPGGREQLEAEAAEIDRQWETARELGEDLQPARGSKVSRPGSRRPRNLRAIGAKIPPSGGGSRWARIVSGSYDEKVIVWKKNADDEWVIGHVLAQEQALTAAGPPIAIGSQPNSYIQTDAPSTSLVAPAPQSSSIAPTQGMPDSTSVPHLAHSPTTLAAFYSDQNDRIPLDPRIQSAISSAAVAAVLEDRGDVDHPMAAAQKDPQSNLRESIPANAQSAEAHLQPSVQESVQTTSRPNISAAAHPSDVLAGTARPDQMATATTVSRHPQLPATQPNARVFKLQFDARRVICCSQDNKIVGWDFANGDEDIMACSKFFADPQ